MKRFVFVGGIAAVAACGAVAACSTFDAADDEPAPTPAVDGDASRAEDAARPGEDGGGPGRFCQSEMEFCADFDGENVGWSATSVNAMYLAVTDGGLRATLPARAVAPADSYVGGVYELTTTQGVDFQVEADLLVEKPATPVLGPLPGDSDLVILKILYRNTGVLAEVRFGADDGDTFSAVLYGRPGDKLGATSLPVRFGEWVHFKLEAQGVVGDAGGGHATLTVGGIPVSVVLDLSPPAAATPEVQLGVLLFKGTTQSDLVVHYDNVVGKKLSP